MRVDCPTCRHFCMTPVFKDGVCVSFMICPNCMGLGTVEDECEDGLG